MYGVLVSKSRGPEGSSSKHEQDLRSCFLGGGSSRLEVA